MKHLNTQDDILASYQSTVTHSIDEVFLTIKGLPSFRMYTKDGVYIFEGDIQDLGNKLTDITPDTIGGFTDLQGNSIVRFGPGNDHGFLDRGEIGVLLQKVYQYNESLKISEHEKKSKQLDDIKEAYTRLLIAHRGEVDDEAFLVAHGALPYQEEITTYPLISGEIGQRFDAHGIAKGDQLGNLISLLSHGIDTSRPFFTAPFELPDNLKAAIGPVLGTAGGTAYKAGIAVLVGRYNTPLQEGIGCVFINDAYADIINPLKTCFPKHSFYLLSEQERVLKEMALDIENKKY